MSNVRGTITPAATKIITYLQTRLSDIGVPVEALPEGYVAREVPSHINIAVEDDTVFDVWSSLDSEGRSLEVNIEVRCKHNEYAYTEAKAIAARVEQLLSANRGQHTVDGGTVIAERVAETIEPSREGETLMVLLPVEYSMLHRITRGVPDVIKP